MKYETFSTRLGKHLATIRQDKGMTQAQLARKADLSLKFTSMIETGANPSLKTVMKVCTALDVTLEDVMIEADIGKVAGKKPKKLQEVQVDVPTEDPLIRKTIKFIKGLDENDRRRALKLIKTSFGDR